MLVQPINELLGVTDGQQNIVFLLVLIHFTLFYQILRVKEHFALMFCENIS